MRLTPYHALLVAISLILGAATPFLWERLNRAPKIKENTEASEPPATLIKLSQEQISRANIEIAAVGSGTLTRRITVPATIRPDPDHLASVAAKVVGVVAQLRKKLGAEVARDETIAIVDSREVADAKSEYLAAVVNHDLQEQLFKREKGLFEKKVIAEQMFLRAKTVYAEAKVKLDLARQKLAALDLSEAEITDLANQPIDRLREKEIRAPLAGRVIDRLVNIGQPVKAESQIYLIADLSIVEVDLAIPLAHLSLIHEGQPVTLKLANDRLVSGAISIISAQITPETRTGHVIATFKNPDFTLNPGSVLNAEIALSQTPVQMLIPRSAVQLIHNQATVFKRVADGFEERRIETGEGDDQAIEVTRGLLPGEKIAISNSFVLKAEMGKNDIPEE